MRLFNESSAAEADQPEVVSISDPENDHNAYQVTDHFGPPLIPFRVVATTPLTWARSPIKKVKFSDGIKAWMDYDMGFRNWVKACVMLAAENGLKSAICSIPDCYRDDVGEAVTIENVDGLIHVME